MKIIKTTQGVKEILLTRFNARLENLKSEQQSKVTVSGQTLESVEPNKLTIREQNL